MQLDITLGELSLELSSMVLSYSHSRQSLKIFLVGSGTNAHLPLTVL